MTSWKHCLSLSGNSNVNSPAKTNIKVPNNVIKRTTKLFILNKDMLLYLKCLITKSPSRKSNIGPNIRNFSFLAWICGHPQNKDGGARQTGK